MRSTRSGLALGKVEALVLVSLILAHSTQPTSAYYFEGFVRWANTAFQGGPAIPNCSTSGLAWIDFVYALVQQKAPTVGTGQLTQACTACSTEIDATLSLYPSSQPSVCQLLPNASLATLTAVSLRRFVCLGASGGGGAGSCVVAVVNALQAANLLRRVRLQDPTLSFTGSLLQDLCAALVPPPPAPPSCCPRTWAYTMAALASQSCLPGLAHEYLSLPGRCEAVLGRTVPGFCEASWPSDLLPLLTPPAVCVAAAAAAPGAAAWANGSACSTSQLGQLEKASSSCDLWCGLVGDMDRIDSGVIPSPDDGGGGGGQNGTTAGEGGGGSGGGGEELQTATIVVVCVFSVLIAALLVAMAMFTWKVHNEKKAVARDKFGFDEDLIFPPPGLPAAGDFLPGTSAIGAAKLQTISTDIGAGGSVSVVASAAAAAAAAAADATTPRYQPGRMGGSGNGSDGLGTTTLTFAAVAPADAARSYTRQLSGQPITGFAVSSTMDRTASSPGLGVTGSAAAAAAAAAGGIVRSSSRGSSSSSRYESAASTFFKSVGTRGSGNLVTPTGNTSFVTVAGSESVTTTPMAVPSGAATDRIVSHPVSLSGSDATTVYQTAQSPRLEGLMTAAGGMQAASSFAEAGGSIGAVPSQGSSAGLGPGTSRSQWLGRLPANPLA